MLWVEFAFFLFMLWDFLFFIFYFFFLGWESAGEKRWLPQDIYIRHAKDHGRATFGIRGSSLIGRDVLNRTYGVVGYFFLSFFLQKKRSTCTHILLVQTCSLLLPGVKRFRRQGKDDLESNSKDVVIFYFFGIYS